MKAKEEYRVLGLRPELRKSPPCLTKLCSSSCLCPLKDAAGVGLVVEDDWWIVDGGGKLHIIVMYTDREIDMSLNEWNSLLSFAWRPWICILSIDSSPVHHLPHTPPSPPSPSRSSSSSSSTVWLVTFFVINKYLAYVYVCRPIYLLVIYSFLVIQNLDAKRWAQCWLLIWCTQCWLRFKSKKFHQLKYNKDFKN